MVDGRMDLLQLIVLALVQGITEFLPVSSSAHLILIPELTGWTDQGTTVDVAAHLGTLLAVIVYFRRDATQMLKGALGQGGARAREANDCCSKWSSPRCQSSLPDCCSRVSLKVICATGS